MKTVENRQWTKTPNQKDPAFLPIEIHHRLAHPSLFRLEQIHQEHGDVRNQKEGDGLFSRLRVAQMRIALDPELTGYVDKARLNSNLKILSLVDFPT